MNICIDDININYKKEGQKGSAILLLHGWGSNIELFNSMIASLSKEHIVYALDLPGFGKSEEPKKSMDVSGYVDFVIKFIEKMEIKKVSILGHSFGGRIIIKMANRDNLTFKIDRLVLLDSAGIKPKDNGGKTLKSRFYKFSKKVVNTKLVKKIAPNALEKLKSKFGSEDYKNASPVMREVLVKTVNEDLEPLLKGINYPTLLVWGENDDATPLSDAKIMEREIKDSGLVVVKYGSHYSFLDDPIFVNRVLENFFLDKEK